MSIKLFVAGTDTGIGKTYISAGLLRAFNRLGYKTIGMKPIASGCFWQDGKLYNEDALALNAASSISLPYEYTNPLAFEPPIAPHIAALHANVPLSISHILDKSATGLNHPCDVLVIEGVGGWSVPLNDHETMADFVYYLNIPVVLVVGIKLGCINHAILTYQAIRQANVTVVGWVANLCEESVLVETDIVTTLKHWLNIPFLGQVPYLAKPEDYLEMNKLAEILDNIDACVSTAED